MLCVGALCRTRTINAAREFGGRLAASSGKAVSTGAMLSSLPNAAGRCAAHRTSCAENLLGLLLAEKQSKRHFFYQNHNC
jgi:hypothetical protein